MRWENDLVTVRKPTKGKSRRRKNERRILVLDADPLALVVATLFATLVMGLCFFYRQVSGFDVVIRAGLTFVAAYFASFLLILFLKHIAATELKEEEAVGEEEEPRGDGDGAAG
ncbi:MAG: hypothetical protein QG656_2563 [Candidatus Hydrogenedentes bacterium]|nr:hypothetical protein [Candidatus Hydrogenedentota bacterium]